MLIIPTPLGDLDAAFDPEGNLTRLMFVPPAQAMKGDISRAMASNAELLISELNAYFSGKLKEFSVPMAPNGTPFQQRVWERLLTIPFGKTTSYGKIANDLGDINLSRAVGSANGSNPIFLLIPCHRVIGANGQLTGYAGGIERKAELLSLERGSAGALF